MKTLITTSFGMALVAIGLAALGANQAHAQTSPLLRLNSFQIQPGQPVQFTFADSGTGATNYVVEFRDHLAIVGTWSVVPDAVVSSLSGGLYQVEAPDPQSAQGYYRVRGLTPAGTAVTASFNTDAFRVTEGGMVQPVIQFSAPYSGVVRYTISGTAAAGDFLSLSGEVTANGTSAVIPITLTDNQIISQFKYLTLTLEAGPGLQVTGANTANITIDENDADWRGNVVTGRMVVGFVLSLRESNGARTAVLRGDTGGVLSAQDIDVALVLNEDNFMADAVGIPLDAGASLLSAPAEFALLLCAANGQPDEEVTPDFIRGTASLITVVPSLPHLNTTNQGMFFLQKPAVLPSTNQVDLVTIP